MIIKVSIPIIAGIIAGMLFPIWICIGVYGLYILNKWINSTTNSTIDTVSKHSLLDNNIFLSILTKKDPEFAQKIRKIRGEQQHVQRN